MTSHLPEVMLQCRSEAQALTHVCFQLYKPFHFVVYVLQQPFEKVY